MSLVTPQDANRLWVDESLLAKTGEVDCLVQLAPNEPEALRALEGLRKAGAVRIEQATWAYLRMMRLVAPWRNGSHFQMTICFGDDEAMRNLFRESVLPHLRSFKRNACIEPIARNGAHKHCVTCGQPSK